LERLGLIANTAAGEGRRHSKGEPNAWVLTVVGERVAQGIRVSQSESDERYEEALR